MALFFRSTARWLVSRSWGCSVNAHTFSGFVLLGHGMVDFEPTELSADQVSELSKMVTACPRWYVVHVTMPSEPHDSRVAIRCNPLWPHSTAVEAGECVRHVRSYLHALAAMPVDFANCVFFDQPLPAHALR